MFDLVETKIDWREIIAQDSPGSDLLLQMKIFGLPIYRDMLGEYEGIFIKHGVAERAQRCKEVRAAAQLFGGDIVAKIPRFEHVHHAQSPKGDHALVEKIREHVGVITAKKFILSDSIESDPLYERFLKIARSGDPRPAKWFLDALFVRVDTHLNQGALAGVA